MAEQSVQKFPIDRCCLRPQKTVLRHGQEISESAACQKSSSRREEGLTFLFFLKKFEPRYLGCYTGRSF
ncbi:MAG: hypothetical protein DME19_07415 [Verrucomicrobia bacterium]|nr:MAG: hypothetical protein DME19_07415 [Verrucomicrobiota bacterium]